MSAHNVRSQPTATGRRSCPAATAASVSGALALSGVLAGNVGAELIAGPDIIAPPASVLDDDTPNDHQQAFNEKQVFVLPAPIEIDPGGVFIPAGTVVSSHLIFFDSDGGILRHDHGQVWTFDAEIAGVMSDLTGSLEAATSALLGASGTTYPTAASANRGLEDPSYAFPDSYSASGDSITVDMSSSTPGDWMRVITLPCDRYVGFDALPLGPIVVPPATIAFIEDGIPASFHLFSTGAYGTPEVQIALPYFGQNQILYLPNVNLGLDLRNRCVEEVSFVFMDTGGFENLQVNGAPLYVGELELAPAAIAPGVTLAVGPARAVPGGEVRVVTLTGPVRRLLVGGQEFWVDKFCITDHDCLGDIDCDGIVGFTDLLMVLSASGPCGGPICPEDLDGDGSVGFSDVLIVLANWGPC